MKLGNHSKNKQTQKFSSAIADSKLIYSQAVIITLSTLAIRYEQTINTVSRVAERTLL